MAFYSLILLIATIAFIILSSSYWKWHPFTSLISASLIFGIFSGIAPVEVISHMLTGFGSLVGTIGLIVVLGSILGVTLEKSGYVTHIGDWFVRHNRINPSLGMALLGMVLGIPVFCDSGFIILVNLARSVSISSGSPFASVSLGLSGGLYTTHTLVPPTPGPIAAAGNLGVEQSLGIIILLGIIVSVPVVLVVYFYAKYIGSRLPLNYTEQTIEPVVDSAKLGRAIALILTPVLLIAVSSVFTLLFKHDVPWIHAVRFIGHPSIALLITLSLAYCFFRREQFHAWTTTGIYRAGPVLILTGCGGALGAVLKASPVATMISTWVQDQTLTGMGFLLTGFFISALFKTAQGSSTSAIVVVSALTAPLTLQAGFSSPVELSLLVLAIGAGAMTVSHANDSYFWVVSQFSGFNLRSAYMGITIMSLLQGITAFCVVLLLYVILV